MAGAALRVSGVQVCEADTEGYGHCVPGDVGWLHGPVRRTGFKVSTECPKVSLRDPRSILSSRVISARCHGSAATA